MKIVIVGLGLIGGSLSKAIKKNTIHSVFGIDSNSEVIAAAKKENAIDAEGKQKDLQDADIIIIALYPAATVNFTKENGKYISKNAVVIDVCGIKTDICREMTALSEKFGFTFIGAHPMAGKEKGGFENSDADMFIGASFIITPQIENKESEKTLIELASQIGFSQTVRTTPEEHDKIIAFTSQLPHVLANAYIKSPQGPRHKGFSAGSYRDVSRVAHINEFLWAELFLQNKNFLIEEIDTFIKNINLVREAIIGENHEKLVQLLLTGGKIKGEIDE